MFGKEHKLSREEALKSVGDIVKRMVEISKEHDIHFSDPEKFKSDLRVTLLKDLEMLGEIEEPLPSQTVGEYDPGIIIDVALPSRTVGKDEPILSEEGGGVSAKPKFEIESDEYKQPINFKLTEEGAGNAHFYGF